MKRKKTYGQKKTIKSIFDTLPVLVAAKTGTAEKSGKIPTENEVEYLKSHMASYGVSTEEAVSLAEKMKKEYCEITDEFLNILEENKIA